MFIADSANDCIRKVDTSGVITTVAGNGSYGYSGDGDAATNLSLDYPMDVAVDRAGNLFIADTWNSLIRKVDTNGTMTTVAGYVTDGYILWGFGGDGGAATTAELRFPSSVALDAAGNLFITDTANNRVRKVDTHGIITTVAGNGVEDYSGDGGAAVYAALNTPVGIAVDAWDNLFISDSGNQRVRKVDTNGIITTVAGNGTNGYSGDGGAPTNAALSSPADVAVDAIGNLFIADSDNNRIREVTSSQGPTLTLRDITKNDAGHYRVIVTSPTGSVTSSSVHLTVLPAAVTQQKKRRK
jgi:sugar lactone lactonase YvrE